MVNKESIELFHDGIIALRENNYERAVTALTKAISLQDNVSNYHNNLGLAYLGQGKTEQAIKCFEKAVELDPQNSHPYYCFGVVFQKKGAIEASLVNYRKAFLLDSSYTDALANIINILLCSGENDVALSSLEPSSSSEDDWRRLILTSNRMIIDWINRACDFGVYEPVSLEENIRTKNYLMYFGYLTKLMDFYKQNRALFNDGKRHIPIYVFGDSHSLAFSNLIMGKCVGKTELIMGMKMWHFSSHDNHFFRACLKARLSKLPLHSHLLFTFGEIDCRPDEGIWIACQNGKGSLSELIFSTVTNYISWLKDHLASSVPASLTIQGVPAPTYQNPGADFIDMVKNVNSLLQEQALNNGWRFLDVYDAPHIDDHHILPSFYSALHWA